MPEELKQHAISNCNLCRGCLFNMTMGTENQLVGENSSRKIYCEACELAYVFKLNSLRERT